MSDERPPDPRVALLKELADPVRLRVIDRLFNTGESTVSQLAAALGVSLPQLSNHLKRLRVAGLVSGERRGRQVVYTLADPGLEALMPLLDSLTGRVATRPAGADEAPSRTCYGHLGGAIGVALYRRLVDLDALAPRADGHVELGPAALPVLRKLGIDDPAPRPADRRRHAFECLDATHHAPHLAGALGDALAEALLDRGWIARAPDGSRTVTTTPAGRRGLNRALALELP
jgi:DNA-binding transcriptional ArsR family regulator